MVLRPVPHVLGPRQAPGCCTAGPAALYDLLSPDALPIYMGRAGREPRGNDLLGRVPREAEQLVREE